MARPVYRVPGYPSDRARGFVATLGLDETGQNIWLQYIPHFESACILYPFEDALFAFPFVVTDEKQLIGLKDLHRYNRTMAGAEVGEVLLEKTSSDKSITAIQTLIEAMIDGSTAKSTSNKLIINLAK